jgi:5-methylcytosine-specific restriction endonuclease McrA
MSQKILHDGGASVNGRRTWTDHLGREWPVVRSHRRLKFGYPAHAALRAFVFHRDGFRCVRCPAKVAVAPETYDGRQTLETDTLTGKPGDRYRWADCLVVDHVLTLPAGGTSHPNNLQTLCETCNRRKQREDKAATAAYRARGAA